MSCDATIADHAAELEQKMRLARVRSAEVRAEVERVHAEAQRLWALRYEAQCHLPGCDCNGTEAPASTPRAFEAAL